MSRVSVASAFGCIPLQQLSPVGADAWQATGDDPQFLARLPAPLQVETCCEVSVVIDGDGDGDAIEPVLYLDPGDGWSEATRRRLVRRDRRTWSWFGVLPVGFVQARFDPCDRPLSFGFAADGLTVETLDPAAAVLALVSADAAAHPGSAHTVLAEAARRLAIDGPAAALAWLQDGGPAAMRSPGVDYSAWRAAHDTLDAADRAALAAAVERLPVRPMVSVWLPARVAGVAGLRACVASVLAQLYPDWCLWIDLDGVVDGDVRAAAEAFSAAHRRIRIGTGAAADGDWFVPLRHAQVLRPHALLVSVEAALATGGPAIVYWDEDRDDGRGGATDPDFKPAWNPSLFLTRGYFDDTVMVAGERIRAAGGFDPARVDAVADLLLRCVAAAGPAPVRVPLLLSRLPLPADVSPATRADAVRRHLDHIDGIDIDAVAVGLHIRYPLPDPPPLVSIIVPTRDRVELLRTCVDSVLARSSYPAFELLVIDNQSEAPETLEYFATIAGDPRVRVLAHDAPFNYARINNAAVAEARGSVVALLNNDIEVLSSDWLEEMVSIALQPGTGAVGAMLYYPDDTIQHAGVVVGLGGVAGHVYSRAARGTSGHHGRAALAQDMSAVTAACLVVRTDHYLEAGGLDETLEVAFNDIDFCLRLRELGYRNVWTPHAELYHHESASRGFEDTPAKLARFHREVSRMHDKWPGVLGNDPAYHPSLSLAHGAAMALAETPRAGLRDWLQRHGRVR